MERKAAVLDLKDVGVLVGDSCSHRRFSDVFYPSAGMVDAHRPFFVGRVAGVAFSDAFCGVAIAQLPALRKKTFRRNALLSVFRLPALRRKVRRADVKYEGRTVALST